MDKIRNYFKPKEDHSKRNLALLALLLGTGFAFIQSKTWKGRKPIILDTTFFRKISEGIKEAKDKTLAQINDLKKQITDIRKLHEENQKNINIHICFFIFY